MKFCSNDGFETIVCIETNRFPRHVDFDNQEIDIFALKSKNLNRSWILKIYGVAVGMAVPGVAVKF